MLKLRIVALGAFALVIGAAPAAHSDYAVCWSYGCADGTTCLIDSLGDNQCQTTTICDGSTCDWVVTDPLSGGSGGNGGGTGGDPPPPCDATCQCGNTANAHKAACDRSIDGDPTTGQASMSMLCLSDASKTSNEYCSWRPEARRLTVSDDEYYQYGSDYCCTPISADQPDTCKPITKAACKGIIAKQLSLAALRNCNNRVIYGISDPLDDWLKDFKIAIELSWFKAEFGGTADQIKIDGTFMADACRGKVDIARMGCTKLLRCETLACSGTVPDDCKAPPKP